VAGAAGVSIKTVSRVLNHEPNVRAETRRRVNEAIAELGFRPNMAARRLAGARSFLLGLLIHDAAPSYVGGVQFGATKRCRADGYHLMVELLDAADPAAQVRDLIGDLRLDGLILTPPVCDDEAILGVLEALETPYVRIAPGQDMERAARVKVDDRAAAAELTRHLLSLGHRDIGFVSGPAHHRAALRRLDGFQDAMAEAGAPVDPLWMVEGDFSVRSGMAAGERLLSGERVPSAVFACNDDMALGVMSAAHRRGLRVPEGLSVAGFDGAAAGQSIWPRLTTVRQPLFEIGEAAADLLITRTAAGEGEAPLVRLPCSLEAGGTVAPLGQDPASGR
jgi:LacI family transcriptional regulator